MPAHRSLAFVYHQCTKGLDEDERLEVDAVLGDGVAAERVQELRREALAAMGAEIG